MDIVRMPRTINFGEDALSQTKYPKNALVITTVPASISDVWLKKMGIEDYVLYDQVEPEPSIETVNKILEKFRSKELSAVIGLGGGSSLDVAKYVGRERDLAKILVPTTFGTGSEMTTYCVIKLDGKKKLLQDEKFLADVAVVDPYFLKGTPEEIVKNSVCDACAQATEGYDSKKGNQFTKMLCASAFDILYDAIINDKQENYPLGSMLSGIGFGNSSTTLGHALSYVFSNEGVAHGYALSSCTTVAHKFNHSIYYERFKEIVEKLGFERLQLKMQLEQAAKIVIEDRGHLEPNPIGVSEQDIVGMLRQINEGKL